MSNRDDRVYFGVTVSKRRAEYLYKCLHRPLCGYCERELDECEADPCVDRLVDQGELAYCTGCGNTFDPAALTGYFCRDCFERQQRGEEEEESRMMRSDRA